jgi:hypothetical protein
MVSSQNGGVFFPHQSYSPSSSPWSVQTIRRVSSQREDAFYITGHARKIEQTELRRTLSDQFVPGAHEVHSTSPSPEHDLFEFHISRCLLTTTTGHEDPSPRHTGLARSAFLTEHQRRTGTGLTAHSEMVSYTRRSLAPRSDQAHPQKC